MIWMYGLIVFIIILGIILMAKLIDLQASLDSLTQAQVAETQAIQALAAALASLPTGISEADLDPINIGIQTAAATSVANTQAITALTPKTV